MRRRALLFVGLMFGVMLFFIAYPYHKSLCEDAAALFFGDKTLYSSQFDEQKFHQLVHGFTKEQVMKSLGEPLKKGGKNEEYWFYSLPKSGFGMHRVRILEFDHGILIKKETGFDVD